MIHYPQTADEACRALMDGNFNMCVPWYLMAGWLYEKNNETVLSDEFWDQMVLEMTSRWDEVTHRHKVFVDAKDGVVNRSAAYLTEPDFLPLYTTSSALSLMALVRAWYLNPVTRGGPFTL